MKEFIIAGSFVLAASASAYAGPLNVSDPTAAGIHMVIASALSNRVDTTRKGQQALTDAPLSAVKSQQTVTDAPLPAVPLPAAGLMLLAGLGGLAALRRRAKA